MKKTDWSAPLRAKLPSDYFAEMVGFVNRVYQEGRVFPPKDKIFKAIETTSLAAVKVIIVGQDPYHEEGQAQGLSFSVPDTVTAPPSLNNILKELESDLGVKKASHDLLPWAEQGVLLLNSVLTVPQGRANAHAGLIWEQLTDALIQIASEDERPKVFILWGRFAQQKAALIDEQRHLIIESAHPSPFSADRGFFGSKPFSRANQFLEEEGESPIQWDK